MLADMIAEIDARNEVRREAGLPLLSVTAELRPFLLEEGFELVLSLMSFRPRVIGHPMHSSRYRRMVCATCWDRDDIRAGAGSATGLGVGRRRGRRQ